MYYMVEARTSSKPVPTIFKKSTDLSSLRPPRPFASSIPTAKYKQPIKIVCVALTSCSYHADLGTPQARTIEPVRRNRELRVRAGKVPIQRQVVDEDASVELPPEFAGASWSRRSSR